MRYTCLRLGLVLGVVLSAPADAQLFGTPKFRIEQSDDRFSTTGLTTYSGLWNRLSRRSVAGGVHIDGNGMFVEPVVIRRKADGGLAALLLFVHNEVSYNSGIPSGLLTLGQPTMITFLTAQGPVALRLERSGSRWGDISSYDRITGSVTTHLSESGYAQVTPAQYQLIMNAPALATKIDGDRRSVIFEAKDISRTFQPNLRTFWTGYIDIPSKSQ